MTYRELLQSLEKLDKEQLECDVIIYDSFEDKYFWADFDITLHSDVLDKNHPIIVSGKGI